MFDIQYLEEIKEIYKAEILSGKMREEDYLAKRGLIGLDKEGCVNTVYAEYPIVSIIKKNDTEDSFDNGGMLEALKNKVKELKQDGTIKNAYVEYTPKFLSYWRLAEQFLTNKTKNTATSPFESSKTSNLSSPFDNGDIMKSAVQAIEVIDDLAEQSKAAVEMLKGLESYCLKHPESVKAIALYEDMEKKLEKFLATKNQ